jgi:membrane associated rhomboid family serine protease
MKPQPPPPRQRIWTGGTGGFLQNPVYIIIIINLIVYFASFIDSQKLIYYFGIAPSLFTEHPWSIITAMFVHVDFWHIFGNMIVLFFFGQLIYRVLGAKWFLLLFFVSGIVGNGIYLWLGDPNTFAVGASGAIYGITGALVVMMPNLRVALWGILPMPLWVFVIIFMGIWSIPAINPYIGWQAHLGGFVIGLIAGFYFRRSRRYIYFA